MEPNGPKDCRHKQIHWTKVICMVDEWIFFCIIDNGVKKLKEMKDCVSSNNKFELSLLFLAFHKRNSLLMRLNYVPLKSSTKDQL